MKSVIPILVVLCILAVGVLLYMQSDRRTSSGRQGEIAFEYDEHDFGVILQSGGIVSAEFPFTYSGTIERTVVGVPGSCGCTTADIDVDVLSPGTAGTITVNFDPNLHEEPEGRFFKTVSLVTDPPLEEDAEIKVWTEIDLDLGPEYFKLQSNNDSAHMNDHESGRAFGEIHADELATRLEDKDFFLVDVHTPEQEHIEGTDEVIPYNELSINLDKLPQDKSQEIILYCRSGSMSQVAAQTLIDNGYTNVSHLEGGIKAYNAHIN